MKNYKLIATDLDGTLLDSRGNVSRENLTAIENLAKIDVNVVLSTGRTLSEIPKQLKNNINIPFLIGSNGAGVWDLKTREKIVSLAINKDLSNEIFNILREYKTNITFRYKGESYVDATDWGEEKLSYYHICEPHISAIRKFANHLENFYEFAYNLDQIECYAVFFHSEAEMEECYKRLCNNGDLLVVKAWDYNLEIFHKNSGKGNALIELAKKLDIPISQTVAVGDSNNDSSMIISSGLGLCTANGNENLKLLADKTICSNDEHIMDYIFNNYY